MPPPPPAKTGGIADEQTPVGGEKDRVRRRGAEEDLGRSGQVIGRAGHSRGGVANPRPGRGEGTRDGSCGGAEMRIEEGGRVSVFVEYERIDREREGERIRLLSRLSPPMRYRGKGGKGEAGKRPKFSWDKWPLWVSGVK